MVTEILAFIRELLASASGVGQALFPEYVAPHSTAVREFVGDLRDLGLWR